MVPEGNSVTVSEIIRERAEVIDDIYQVIAGLCSKGKVPLGGDLNVRVGANVGHWGGYQDEQQVVKHNIINSDYFVNNCGRWLLKKALEWDFYLLPGNMVPGCVQLLSQRRPFGAGPLCCY